MGYGKSGKRECSPKSSAFVDRMETQTVAATNQLCKQYGKKDPRVSTTDYVMGNHGLIVSYGKVKQQVVHIDLWHTKQFQFGMMFSDKSKGTLEYETIGPDLGEVKST